MPMRSARPASDAGRWTGDHGGNGNSVSISAVGARDRLKFCRSVNGTPTWHAEIVAGPGSVR
jgi:hypothetical protein